MGPLFWVAWMGIGLFVVAFLGLVALLTCKKEHKHE